jgi:hypothetical protein
MLFAAGASNPSAVHAVCRGCVESERRRGVLSVERKRGSRERTRSERTVRQARSQVSLSTRVSTEHLREGEPVVGEPHRLRALQMGVAGQHRVEVLGGSIDQNAPEFQDASLGGL